MVRSSANQGKNILAKAPVVACGEALHLKCVALPFGRS